MVFAPAAHAAEAQKQPSPLKSGIEFASADLRKLQADDFANPGMLWVARGEKLWSEPAGKSGKSCASCHQDGRASMKGVAARYPRVDPGAARLVNLEGRINLCRARNQEAEEFQYESDGLLALTTYVAHMSRGARVAVARGAQQLRLVAHRECVGGAVFRRDHAPQRVTAIRLTTRANPRSRSVSLTG